MRAKTSLLLVFFATAQASDRADALPTFFDFLGAMVEQEGEWVDPLDMAQSFQTLDDEVLASQELAQDPELGTASEAAPSAISASKSGAAVDPQALDKESP